MLYNNIIKHNWEEDYTVYDEDAKTSLFFLLLFFSVRLRNISVLLGYSFGCGSTFELFFLFKLYKVQISFYVGVWI